MTALAPYACHAEASRGREHREAPPVNRSQYQRDRDRVIHAKAFRRLEYKTQVFVNHEGDWFRTRLTHTLEVAQIARTVARSLALNEDLTEAIALAHDLGHTPFGHAGQDALNACLRAPEQPRPDLAPAAGGFEHNLQSLRVVDKLETRYAAFDGLNLCFETREGILKHCSAANARKLGAVAARFLTRSQPSLEAQLANLADEIAYNNHDIDDGLRAGLLTPAQLQDVDLYARHRSEVARAYPQIPERRAASETIRRMISTLILDLTATTAARIADTAPRDADAVRQAPPLAAFSDPIRRDADALKRFLHENLYRHPQVQRTTRAAQGVVRDLYRAYLTDPQTLPPRWRTPEPTRQPRAVADYIAGMTDRYAIGEHQRVVGGEAVPSLFAGGV